MAVVLANFGFQNIYNKDIELTQDGNPKNPALPPVKRISALLKDDNILIIQYIPDQWDSHHMPRDVTHAFIFMSTTMIGLISLPNLHIYCDASITPKYYKEIIEIFLTAGNTISIMVADGIRPLVRDSVLYI